MKQWILIRGLMLVTSPAYARQCLHGPDSTPEQKARRTQAIGGTRAVNNMQANKAGIIYTAEPLR